MSCGSHWLYAISIYGGELGDKEKLTGSCAVEKWKMKEAKVLEQADLGVLFATQGHGDIQGQDAVKSRDVKLLKSIHGIDMPQVRKSILVVVSIPKDTPPPVGCLETLYSMSTLLYTNLQYDWRKAVLTIVGRNCRNKKFIP